MLEVDFNWFRSSRGAYRISEHQERHQNTKNWIQQRRMVILTEIVQSGAVKGRSFYYGLDFHLIRKLSSDSDSDSEGRNKPKYIFSDFFNQRMGLAKFSNCVYLLAGDDLDNMH
jgi:hypothetical protein